MSGNQARRRNDGACLWIKRTKGQKKYQAEVREMVFLTTKGRTLKKRGKCQISAFQDLSYLACLNYTGDSHFLFFLSFALERIFSRTWNTNLSIPFSLSEYTYCAIYADTASIVFRTM